MVDSSFDRKSSMIFILLLLKISLVQSTLTRSMLDLLTKKSSRQWYQNETQQASSENRYCSICCVDIQQSYKGRKCGIHTMCAYATKPIGTTCRGMIVMDFSQNEIDAIVDVHNTLRNRIAMGQEEDGDPGPQFPAANMRLISWDKELANIALLWATQCVFSHDKCRDLERFPVGQNIAEGSYASKSDIEHIADWYELVQYTNNEDIKSFDRKKHEHIDHYTQLVWADTYLIGCARVSFQKPLRGEIIYKEHFFCNYGPSGNIPYQSVYKVGEACTACSEGTFCTNPEYPGLCGNEVLNETHFKMLRKKHRTALNKNRSECLLQADLIFLAVMVTISHWSINKNI